MSLRRRRGLRSADQGRLLGKIKAHLHVQEALPNASLLNEMLQADDDAEELVDDRQGLCSSCADEQQGARSRGTRSTSAQVLHL